MTSIGQELGDRNGTRRILRVRAIVHIGSPQLLYQAKTENLGLDGMAFRMENHLSEKSRLTINFSMFQGPGLVDITIKGIVVYSLLSCDSFLTGIRYDSVDETAKKFVNAYVSSR